MQDAELAYYYCRAQKLEVILNNIKTNFNTYLSNFIQDNLYNVNYAISFCSSKLRDFDPIQYSIKIMNSESRATDFKNPTYPDLMNLTHFA
jgi:hypothetical protein